MTTKSKDFFKNIGYSFLSFALPTVFLQFIIQPLIASKIGAESNGQYLTLMSLNFFMIGITGSVLNTVRLLQNKKYDDQHLVGDFNIILVIYLAIILLFMPIGMIVYTRSINVLDIFLYMIIGVLYLYHDYIFAQYRLNLAYNKILINNIIMVCGYSVGLVLFINTLKWQLVFITAYSFTFIYDFLNTDFIKEPIKKTPLFNDTLKVLLVFTVSSLLSSAITYFDKLLLYPLLGGTSVSIYNTATLVGKILLLISGPMSSVFLSYLVQEDKMINRFRKKDYVLIIVVICVGYFTCLFIGYPLTSFLYPKWADESQVLIPITVASSTFFLVSNCLNTILIRFFKTYLQIIIQAIHLVVYLSFAVIGLHYYGLMGFSIGICLSNMLRLILVLSTLRIKPQLFLITD